MVQLTRIYTRSGDKGKTSLGDGTRVNKTNPRVEAYGAIDEANALLGVVRAGLREELPEDRSSEIGEMVIRIQNDLFDLGADVCSPEKEEATAGLRIVETQVQRLEAEIDAMNASLKPLKSFVLPGGGGASARLHAARTVSRRAERRLLTLAECETVNPQALIYLNRLSDHLFVLARYAAAETEEETLWRPGANR